MKEIFKKIEGFSNNAAYVLQTMQQLVSTLKMQLSDEMKGRGSQQA